MNRANKAAAAVGSDSDVIERRHWTKDEVFCVVCHTGVFYLALYCIYCTQVSKLVGLVETHQIDTASSGGGKKRATVKIDWEEVARQMDMTVLRCKYKYKACLNQDLGFV
jgi:hypothetical protein